MANKVFKCPTEYNANIMEQLLNDLYLSVQDKNFQQVEGKPEDAKGSNGEIWVDKNGNKFYIKVAGAWKEGGLT